MERITENNLEYAVIIQNELFPSENGRANFEESIKSDLDYSYYLLYEDGNCVGIIGLYNFGEDQDSAWLGWFGIRKEYRRRKLGSKALKAFEGMAIAKGYRFTRLYTDATDNDGPIAFYKANGYIAETYENPDDPASIKYKMLIFSKSLSSEELLPWNNRNIHLSEQIAKQEKYNSQKVSNE
ncbi:MAG: GNAT family N-acetyltransferase [Erysipelotrichaceae bacterium]|nr:GNAT family N-acetyltransferase [Erysipelotrichaceae bacterium]